MTIVALAAACLFARGAFGQVPVAESNPVGVRALTSFFLAAHPDSSLRDAIARIGADKNRMVRFTSRETGRIEGNHVSLIGDSVFLNTDWGVRAIALTRVDSLWIQSGTAAPIMGIIAAVPCALFGAMVGNFIGGDPDSKGSPGRAIVGLFLGFVGGAFVCGSVGAIVGSLILRWQLEYPRPATESPG